MGAKGHNDFVSESEKNEKGGDTVVREMLDAIYSFIAGFGDRDTADTSNAVFIAKELFKMNLPLEFRGAGRLGVESLELYGILRDAKPQQKNAEAFNEGKTLSEYTARELMLMASYLWNEGRSALDEREREEARALLEKWGRGEEPAKESAVASG